MGTAWPAFGTLKVRIFREHHPRPGRTGLTISWGVPRKCRSPSPQSDGNHRHSENTQTHDPTFFGLAQFLSHLVEIVPGSTFADGFDPDGIADFGDGNGNMIHLHGFQNFGHVRGVTPHMNFVAHFKRTIEESR
jgi:hypothetical protein